MHEKIELTLFSDLDGTLIFSAARKQVGDIVIERKDGREISCITARQMELFPKLKNGNTVFVIAEGRLVNLAAGDGHPAEIMDMSFAIQALSAEYIAKNADNLKAGEQMTVNVPKEIDLKVAERKLAAWGFEIDKLTPEQEKYLGSWEV